MNCTDCRNMMDEFVEGTLPGEIVAKIKYHLDHCRECSEYYSLLRLSERIIEKEKEAEPGPYLVTRIMAVIENSEAQSRESVFTRVLRPALLTLSLAAAVFSGIIIGSAYKPSTNSYAVPLELALMNDDEIENVNVLSAE